MFFSNVYLTAFIFQGIIAAFIFIFFKNYFKSKFDFIFYLIILFPVPVAFFYRNIYVFDLVGFVYVVKILFFNSKLKILSIKEVKKFWLPVFIFLLILPILSTSLYVLHDTLQEKAAIVEQVYRSILIILLARFCILQMYRHPGSINKLIFQYLVIWNILLLLSLLQITGIAETDFIVRNFSSLDAGFLSGFMGLDKPQIALFSVSMFNIALYLPAKTRQAISIKYLTLIGSLIACLMVGSRQGIIFILFSIILGLILRRKSFQYVAINVMILTIVVGIYGLLPAHFTERVDRKFTSTSNSIINISSENFIQGLALTRDPRFIESFAYLFSGGPNILIGNGIGTEKLGYIVANDGSLVSDTSSVRTYFEGEIFRIFWALGFLGVAIYIYIFYKVNKFISTVKNNLLVSNFSSYKNMLYSQMIIIFFYSFGQFGLFTMNLNNTPFVYFIWSLFSMLIGFFMSINRNPKALIY